MTVWIIEPRDPLIVRDGRPFSTIPGARAKTLPFPYPSTIAGGVRTRAGQDENGRFIAAIEDVLQIKVRGPFLVKTSSDHPPVFLAPAPADALLFPVNEVKGMADRKLLTPLPYPDGTASNLPNETLCPVGLPQPDPRKPLSKSPRFWCWPEFEQWLCQPQSNRVKMADLGVAGPASDRRTHVGINPASQTGQDGALFMTSGLAFLHDQAPDRTLLTDIDPLGLAVKVENVPSPLSLTSGYAPLGGERRLMLWRESTAPLPELPDNLVQDVLDADGHCRLILLTPAYFTAGWRPDWLLNKQDKVQVTLKAAIVNTPQTISGWNFEDGKRGPKKTRRLAPAGSVYYLQLQGSEADVRYWLENTIWLQAVSDKDAYRQSGFGLAAIGTWSNEARKLRFKDKEGNHA